MRVKGKKVPVKGGKSGVGHKSTAKVKKAGHGKRGTKRRSFDLRCAAWNIAEYDGSHKNTVRPKEGFEAATKSGIVLLHGQEAGPWTRKELAEAPFQQIIGTGKNLTTFYDESKLKAVGKLQLGSIKCITGHSGEYLFQAFKHKASRRIIGSLNIHGRHPSGSKAVAYHAKQIRLLVASFAKKVDIMISGGDLNEANEHLGEHSLGRGALKKMGGCDRLGAKGRFVRKAKPKWGGSHGSDHCMVVLKVRCF